MPFIIDVRFAYVYEYASQCEKMLRSILTTTNTRNNLDRLRHLFEKLNIS